MTTEPLLFTASNTIRKSRLIKVIIVDKQPLIINGIAALLKEIPSVDCCGIFLNSVELMNWYDGNNADVLLIGMEALSHIDIGASQQLLSGFPLTQIIVFAVDKQENVVLQMLKKSRVSYLLKNATPEMLIDAIIRNYSSILMSGMQSQYAKHVFDVRQAEIKLTKRETEILHLILQGYTNISISQHLHLSELTVKTHRQNIRSKFNAHNTAQIFEKSRLMGLI